MMSSVSLYVHIPFCIRKCPYCDFNSYAVDESLNRNGVTEERYVSALCAELRYFATLPPWKGRTVVTIFFGGGTPSLFQPESFVRIIECISSRFLLTETAEVTIEANPGTISEDLSVPRLEGYRRAGINRISLGAQSFSETKLRTLGRIHAPNQTHDAVENLRHAGFTNCNLDLMFAVAGEPLEEWKNDVETVLSLHPEHLSVYGLTIEPGTEFSRQQSRGGTLTADEDIAAEMFVFTQDRLTASGFTQYELSNYARPGFECQHNLGYWSNRDYLGLGAGAHSYLSAATARELAWGTRWSNLPGPLHYIERVEQQGNAIQRQETLSDVQARTEFFFLGLRRAQGVSAAEYAGRFNRHFEEDLQTPIRLLEDKGLIHFTYPHLQLTKAGFLFADSVFCSIAEHLEQVSPS